MDKARRWSSGDSWIAEAHDDLNRSSPGTGVRGQPHGERSACPFVDIHEGGGHDDILLHHAGVRQAMDSPRAAAGVIHRPVGPHRQVDDAVDAGDKLGCRIQIVGPIHGATKNLSRHELAEKEIPLDDILEMKWREWDWSDITKAEYETYRAFGFKEYTL